MTVFYIADTHFNHTNILKFTNQDGVLIRDGFDSMEEHNEHIIEQWNKKVSDRDTIWHLGDVFFGSETRSRGILERLNGKKNLIVGNHDKITPFMVEYFNKIVLWKKDRKYQTWFSHAPLDQSTLMEMSNDCVNVHGHFHDKGPTIRHLDSFSVHFKYINICPEKVGYAPLTLDEILELKSSKRY